VTSDSVTPNDSGGPSLTTGDLHAAVEDMGNALLSLSQGGHPELAKSLARMVAAIAHEAGRSPRFARALADAGSQVEGASSRAKRPNRRSPGPFDPFAVFTEFGETGLRDRLNSLSIDQLRDIIAEHRMDHDRLAMKWKDTGRLTNRIVERVQARSTKGDAFRS
jgi:hypothetical protein